MGKKWFRAALFALAVVLCSCTAHQTPSASRVNGAPPAKAGNNAPPTATGTMTDWLDSVCLLGTFNDGKRAGLPNADKGQGFCGAKNHHGPILMGIYSSFYMARNDVALYQRSMASAYASVEPGIQVFVGAPGVLEPLTDFGFSVNEPDSALVPHAAPAPDASASPVPNVAAPPSQTSQPYWDGPWLRNYAEGDQDCNGRGLEYWVVQPGDTGMYALKMGCFPQNWVNNLSNHCQQQPFPPGGQCAVWDPDGIMSTFGQHGDLLIVALTRQCLDRAGLTAFHEGPLHHDCVLRP